MLVRYWHNRTEIPDDVQECLDSWRPLAQAGFRLTLFDDDRGRRFIESHFGHRHLAAFDRCRHPAMRSDYFRLCYLVACGGFYIDADEVYLGGKCDRLVGDDLLKVQPLCYDSDTNEMVDVPVFSRAGAASRSWIHYVNNNPLIAPASHPVLEAALARSTRLLEPIPAHRLDIQSTTGPGNLTASLVAHALTTERAGVAADYLFLTEWDQLSVSRWPLSYRNDERNWRLWDPSA
jgi:mannosyltransferase OCH1-like enzyme